MKMPVYQHLFKPLKRKGLRFKNRITMAPLYLGYAATGGRVSPLLLHHYREMARMLWVDPQWPQKAKRGDDRSILKCSPKCDACFRFVMQGKPAYCPKWAQEKRARYRELFR